MNKYVTIAAIAALSACQMAEPAGTGAGASATPQATEALFVAKRLVVQKDVTAGQPYQVGLFVDRSDAVGADATLCFSWNEEGPYCGLGPMATRTLSDGSIMIATELTTGTPGSYLLSAFLEYETDAGVKGKTFLVSAPLVVKPAE